MSLTRQMRIVGDKLETAAAMLSSCPCNGATFRVAFASSDLRQVDEHFGSASRFACYEIVCHTSHLLRAYEFDDTQQDGNESKLAAKIGALADCDAVYCLAVGASAIRQLLAAGIQPIKVGAKAPITDLVELLVEEIHAGRTPWIEKAKQKNLADPGRFDAMLDEAWEE